MICRRRTDPRGSQIGHEASRITKARGYSRYRIVRWVAAEDCSNAALLYTRCQLKDDWKLRLIELSGDSERSPTGHRRKRCSVPDLFFVMSLHRYIHFCGFLVTTSLNLEFLMAALVQKDLLMTWGPGIYLDEGMCMGARGEKTVASVSLTQSPLNNSPR